MNLYLYWMLTDEPIEEDAIFAIYLFINVIFNLDVNILKVRAVPPRSQSPFLSLEKIADPPTDQWRFSGRYFSSLFVCHVYLYITIPSQPQKRFMQ